MKTTCIVVILLFFIQSCIFSQVNQTLTLQPGPDDGFDVYMNSAFASSPNGNSRSLISSAYTYDGEYGIGRSLVKFDFSALPVNAVILSAKLSLFYDPDNGHGVQMDDNASYLQRITSEWDEQTVTWNTQPEYTEINQVLIPASTDPYQSYPNVDITSLVQDIVNPGNVNYGLALKIINEEPYRSMIFASSDNPDSLIRPKLVITYIDCQTVIPDFEYNTQTGITQFTDKSENATFWNWNFGDGYSSSIQNPVHSYQTEGKYLVCLTAGNECSSNTKCDTIKTCDSLFSEFSFDNSNDRLINFTVSATNALTWYWDFGDGFYSDLQNPTHYFNEYGAYMVCLKTNNNCEENILCKTIQVGPNGINEDFLKQISIYPNPSQSEFNILLPGQVENIDFRVLNNAGIDVFSKHIENQAINCSIPALPSGMYTLLVNTDTFAVRFKLVSIR